VWTTYRRGEIEELVHRQRDELLLWDIWGAMSTELDGDLGLIDDVAAALLAADRGDQAADQELTDRYSNDPRLHPGDRVLCHSPRGVIEEVDLLARGAVEASGG
jgi:hypothetical protein